jgi:hypothetical protein
VEDRMTGLKDKIDLTRIVDEYIQKRMKKYDWNMTELCDYIKSLKLGIMDVEGEGVQAKGIGNMLNKVIAENFSNIDKEMLIKVQEASKTPNRHV